VSETAYKLQIFVCYYNSVPVPVDQQLGTLHFHNPKKIGLYEFTSEFKMAIILHG